MDHSDAVTEENTDLVVDVRRLQADEIQLSLANVLDLRIRNIESELSVNVDLDRLLAALDRVLRSLGENPEAQRILLRILNQALGTVEDLAENSVKRGDRHKIDATQAARERAGRLGVDLDRIEGTGVDGRIVVKDVIEPSRK